MTFRISSRTISGAAAFLAFGAAVAVAQDTTRTRSQRRIPISKEAPGEVVRVDTLYRTDTLRITELRVDTLHQTHTVYRVDTVTKYPPPMRIRGGFYGGLAAGVGAPAGAIYTPNAAGPSGQLQLGWQGAKQVLGGRFDLNYTRPGPDSRFSGFQPDPDVWNYNFDLKVQAPWFTRMMGGFGRFAVYGLGGFSITQWKNLPMRIDNPINGDVPLFVVGNCQNVGAITAASIQTINGQQIIVNNVNGVNTINTINGVSTGTCSGWHSKGGWNAGGGASLTYARTELFIESRAIGWRPTNAPQARLIPTVFGINVY